MRLENVVESRIVWAISILFLRRLSFHNLDQDDDGAFFFAVVKL